ncbi:MAG: thiamine pyrophosphate-binding protein [Chloroflexota bacterium]|nr:thiamine pyrophosphate-binding protein [Chloroflexota bacterium]
MADPLAQGVARELKTCGITHIVWLPDSRARFLYQALQAEPSFHMVPVCREGEAFGVAAGLHLGGKKPLVLIQNTGFLESGDSVAGIALDMKLPLLIMIGYQGWSKTAPVNRASALCLEPMMKVWDIPYYFLETEKDLPHIAQADRQAQESARPAAVIITRE